MPSTYTYSGDPRTDRKDAVRALLGDTSGTEGSSTGWLLSDEEILFAIETEGNTRLAAALCCTMIASRWTSLTGGKFVESKGVGDFSHAVTWRANSVNDWNSLAVEFRQSATGAAVPRAGGISLADRAVVAADPDRPTPRAAYGQFDNPDTTSTPTGTGS